MTDVWRGIPKTRQPNGQQEASKTAEEQQVSEAANHLHQLNLKGGPFTFDDQAKNQSSDVYKHLENLNNHLRVFKQHVTAKTSKILYNYIKVNNGLHMSNIKFILDDEYVKKMGKTLVIEDLVNE